MWKHRLCLDGGVREILHCREPYKCEEVVEYDAAQGVAHERDLERACRKHWKQNMDT
jgi:hypothetical protein